MLKPMLPWLITGLVLTLGLVNPSDACASGKMYWGDVGTAQIRRADLDGSNIEDLVTLGGSSAPVGIALDLASGKMYWTDGNFSKIQRADLDGSNVELLVTEDARAIALDLTTPAIPTLSAWGTLLLGSGLLALAAARRRAL